MCIRDRLGIIIVTSRIISPNIYIDEVKHIFSVAAEDLMKFGVCDKIIAEPTGGAHMSREQTADNIYEYLVDAVYRLKKSEIDELLEKRYAKFRKIGMFTE